jgi:DNA-binding transcriptional ArsR family regulator
VTRQIYQPSASGIDLATVLRTLGDPSRLTIVRLLAERGELSCSAVQAELELPLSTCSYHLRLLREAGVTRTRASGTLRHVSLRREDLDDRFPGLLGALTAGTAAPLAVGQEAL